MSEDENNQFLHTALRLEETVLPTPNSLDLERNVATDFLYRFSSKAPNIAELFHVNSKCIPCSTLAPKDESTVEQLKEWYFSTCYDLRKEDLNPDKVKEMCIRFDDLSLEVREALAPFSESGAATDLLFGVDLFLMNKQQVLRLLPRRGLLWVERTVGIKDWNTFRSSLLEGPAELLNSTRHVLFLVGSPWRYMMVYGPRGYRHTLMDAGRILEVLEARISSIGLHAVIVRNFYDNQLDRLLYLDGVEKSVVAVVAISMEDK